jgi:hypothetical protein
MGNWIPDDPTLVAQILKISAARTPTPPAGFVSPMTWGLEPEVVARFEAAGVPREPLSFERDSFAFDFDGPPAALLAEFRRYYGPTMNAFEAAHSAGKADALDAVLRALFERCNAAKDRDRTHIPATFQRVTIVKP